MGRGERHTWNEVCREWEQIGLGEGFVCTCHRLLLLHLETHTPPGSREPPVHVRWAGIPQDPSQRVQGDVSPPPAPKQPMGTHPNQRPSPPASPPQPREKGTVPQDPTTTTTPPYSPPQGQPAASPTTAGGWGFGEERGFGGGGGGG